MPQLSQLLVHEDIEMAEQVRAAIERALGPQADVLHVLNFAEALKRIQQPLFRWSLIVLSASAPGSRTSRWSGESAAAQEFICAARQIQRDVPIIALSIKDDPELRGVLRASGGATSLIKCTSNCVHEIESIARELYENRTVRPTLLELEITLMNIDSGIWRVRRKGRIQSQELGTFAINHNTFKELVELSAGIAEAGEKWTRKMDEVSIQVDRLIFGGSDNELPRKFLRLLNEVGGAESIRVLFTMTSDRQTAMVEALRDVSGAKDYWMLKAPIVRQYTCGGGYAPIFDDEDSQRSEVNCLIVNANPAAGVIDTAQGKVECAALNEISGEATDIVRTLQAARKAGKGVGEVERLDLTRNTGDPAGELLSMLGQQRWDLVHFAGHSFFKRGGKPSLVLDPALGAVLDFERLAKSLHSTRFLFISSCKSADHSFVTQAIESVIPAVLGFRWPVDDAQAATFARSFYESLFTRGKPSFKSIDYAFLAARCKTHERMPGDNAWASPMLLKQLRDDAVN
jgi:hypothetical protein